MTFFDVIEQTQEKNILQCESFTILDNPGGRMAEAIYMFYKRHIYGIHDVLSTKITKRNGYARILYRKAYNP